MRVIDEPITYPSRHVTIALANDSQAAILSDYDPVLTPKYLIPAFKHFGGTWDKTKKAWILHLFSLPGLVSTLKDLKYDVVVDDDVDAAVDRLREMIALSRSAEPVAEYHPTGNTRDIVNAISPDLHPYPFQLAALQFGIQTNGRCIIADEQGLGKTIEAILIAKAFSPERILIVCPVSVAENWVREIKTWMGRDAVVWRSKLGKDVEDIPILIVSYDSLHRIVYRPEMVILDESHYFKNPKTRRTKGVFNKVERAKYVLALTGTPLVNRPIELWPQWYAVQPKSCPSWWVYAKRYCNAHRNNFGWDVSGASNIQELSQLLRTFMLRRTKAQVLPDLPPIVRRVIPIRPDAPSALIKRIKKLLSEGKEKDIAAVLRAEKKAIHEDILREFSEHAEKKAKLPEIADFIYNTLSQDDSKIVIFAKHKVMINALAEILSADGFKYVQITGDTPQEKRQYQVDMFTNNPNYRVAILSLGVAREGLNLQVANHAVMTELDWTPGGLSQAEARIHRIGQTGSALITYLLYGSFEDILYKTLVSKVGTIDGVMGNEDAGGLDLVSALVEQVRGL